MGPATIAALATIAASGIKAASEAHGAQAGKKGSKRQAKESRRQTLADMYNKALQRELDVYKHNQEQGAGTAARRAAALQETASGFTRALR